MPTYVTDIEPILVGDRVATADLATWLGWAAGPAGADRRVERTLGRLHEVMGIEARRTCVADHTKAAGAEMALYRAGPAGSVQAPLEARMALFERVSIETATAALAPLEQPPDHLLQVSCTGYSSPSAAQRVAAARAWHDTTRILSLGHMGCHAAVPALSAAAAAANATAQRHGRPATAAILHIELCTLHLNVERASLDWLTHAALFADGAARVDVSTERPRRGFEVLDDFEAMVGGSCDAMTWQLGGEGFRMHLGREIPRLIAQHVPAQVERFLGQHDLTIADIANVAVHPGGPRVLRATADALGMERCRYRHATAVLRDNGNMSSATLPHVWAAMLADETIPDGAPILSLAFGPGLTVSGHLLRMLR